MKTQYDGIQAPLETIDIKHELVYPSLKHEEVFSCFLCKMNPILPEDLIKHKSIHLNEIISSFSCYLSCPEQIKCDICSSVIEALSLVILEMEQATNSNELCKYDELIEKLEGHQIYCDLYFKIFQLTDYNRNIYDIHGANVDIERHKLINESLESSDISIINAIKTNINVDLLNKQKTKKGNNDEKNLQGKFTKRSYSQMNFTDEDELPLSILSNLNKQKYDVLNVEKLTPNIKRIKKMFMIKVNGNINNLKQINAHLDNQSKNDHSELVSNKLNLQIKKNEGVDKKLPNNGIDTINQDKVAKSKPEVPTVIIRRNKNIKTIQVLKQVQISKENKSNDTVNTIQQTKLQSEELPITDKPIKFVITRNNEVRKEKIIYPIYDSSKLDKYLGLPKFNHLRDPLRSLLLQGMLKNCIMCMYTVKTLDEFYCYSCNLQFHLENDFHNHLQEFTHKYAFNSDVLNLFIWEEKIFDAKHDFNLNEINIFNIIKEILQLNTFSDLVSLEVKYQTPSNVNVDSLNKILEEKNLISDVDCHVCGVKAQVHCCSIKHNNMANWYMAKCIFFINMNNTEQLLSLTNQDIGNKNLYGSTGTKQSISRESECNVPIGKCRICFKMVPLKEVADHLKYHIANRLYKCYICSKAFLYHSSLCMHIQSGIHYNFFRCTEKNCIGLKHCFRVDTSNDVHYHSDSNFHWYDYRHSCGNS